MYKIDKIQKENRRIHIIGKIVSVIIYIILIPIIIYNFTLITKSFLNPNEVPDFFGYKNFVIVSGSMEPTIMVGDAIFVKKVPQNDIKINDIISFYEDDIIVTHRVVDIINENGIVKYRTKGDNNNTVDRKMTDYQKIEGKYQFKINGFGVVTEFLKNRVTLIFLITIMIIIFLYQNRLNKKRQIRKEKRRKFEES